MFRFHKLVSRCYCPTEEVAKRALKAGLEPSQIKVFGLPVRPSFVKPVLPKVGYVSSTYLPSMLSVTSVSLGLLDVWTKPSYSQRESYFCVGFDFKSILPFLMLIEIQMLQI